MNRRSHAMAYVLMAAVGAGLSLSPLADGVDRAVFDAQQSLLRSQLQRDAGLDIVVVGIDESSFERLPEPFALWHPHFGALFEALAGAGAAMVVADVVLPSRRYRDFFPSVSGLPDFDRTLLLGLKALRDARPEIPFLLGQMQDGPCLRPLLAPVMSVARGRLGAITLSQDPDGTVRQYRATVQVSRRCVTDGSDGDAGRLPTLIGAAAKVLGAALDDGIIDYSLGPPYRYVPLHVVLAWHRGGDLGRLRDELGNKVVMVGGVTPAEDRVQAPVALAGWEPGRRLVPGVLVHAQALRTVMFHGRLMPRAGLAAVVLLVAMSALLWFVPPRAATAVPALAVLLAALGAGSGYALAAGLQLPVAAAGLTALLACTARAVHDSLRIRADRRRLRESFSAYVSPNVMREIEQGRITPALRGSRHRICVLFSDVRDFTTRSERSPPEEIIALLNRYFEAMAGAVHRNHGTVDKFIGDGLMAFFGAPNALPNPSRNAFAAAQEMFVLLERLNAELAAAGLAPLQIGVGLHTGDAVIGHVGSAGRHSYTAVGDSVNLASRVEARTKELGYPLLCTAAFVDDLEARTELVPLGPQPIKGRSAVELFGWRPPGRPA